MSYRSRILAALQAGPLTLRDAYAMASNKRSAISRLSEMRERGEITDALVLAGECQRCVCGAAAASCVDDTMPAGATG